MQVDSNNIDNALGSIIEIIQKNSQLENPKCIELFKKYKSKIIEMVLEYNYIELIQGLLIIYPNSEEHIGQIINEHINKIHIDIIDTISSSYPKIFEAILKNINIDKLFTEWDKFILIYSKIKLPEYDSFLSQINNQIYLKMDKLLIYQSNYSYNYNYNNNVGNIIFSDIEKLKFLIEMFINKDAFDEKRKKKIYLSVIEYFIKYNDKIIKYISNDNIAINTNLNLNVNSNINSNANYTLLINMITKYIDHFKIPNILIKQQFETNYDLFLFVCKSGSIDFINWYLEYASFLVIIKTSNYVNIFKNVCGSANVEASKFIFNLIQAAGYKFDSHTLNQVMYSIINNQRWNSNSEDKSDEIIYELIGLGIKPPVGFSKYTDYYNSIKIIGKTK